MLLNDQRQQTSSSSAESPRSHGAKRQQQQPAPSRAPVGLSIAKCYDAFDSKALNVASITWQFCLGARTMVMQRMLSHLNDKSSARLRKDILNRALMESTFSNLGYDSPIEGSLSPGRHGPRL